MKRVDNPPNPFETAYREWLEPAPPVKTEVYQETARSILSENDSPDLPFRWSVNPYRGCQHACPYCYARPYHEYLGFGAGTDFDSKLVVKVNAAELLEDAFRKKTWMRECVNFSGITDCYQPLEAVWSLTRRCLEVCLRYENPAIIVTKAFLVVRDIDLLTELNRRAGVTVFLSIAFADAEMARLVEPQAPPPARRFEAMRRLGEAGVPVGVFVSPVIPGLNESQIHDVLRLASDAGAQSATCTALRLPGSVRQVFLSRLKESMPLRARRVENLLRDIRSGRLDDARFGHRMTGQGVYWESIRRLFELSARRFNLQKARVPKPLGRRLESAPEPAQQTFDF